MDFVQYCVVHLLSVFRSAPVCAVVVWLIQFTAFLKAFGRDGFVHAHTWSSDDKAGVLAPIKKCAAPALVSNGNMSWSNNKRAGAGVTLMIIHCFRYVVITECLLDDIFVFSIKLWSKNTQQCHYFQRNLDLMPVRIKSNALMMFKALIMEQSNDFNTLQKLCKPVF